MDQRSIMALLQEAADQGCGEERRGAIREELTQAASDVNYPVSNPAEELLASLDISRRQILPVIQRTYGNTVWNVFQETASNNPSHLPQLFPIFAALCGDRVELDIQSDDADLSTRSMFAVVQWEIFAETPQGTMQKTEVTFVPSIQSVKQISGRVDGMEASRIGFPRITSIAARGHAPRSWATSCWERSDTLPGPERR